MTCRPCARSGCIVLPSTLSGCSPARPSMCGWLGPVDIGIQHADRGAVGRQRQRQIDRDRRLADAALAGCHGDDVADLLKRLEIALYAVRNNRWSRIRPRPLCDHCSAAKRGANGLAERIMRPVRGKTELNA